MLPPICWAGSRLGWRGAEWFMRDMPIDMVRLALVLLAFASIAAFLFGLAEDHETLRLVSKPIPVIVLLLAVAQRGTGPLMWGVVTGLALSAVGDVLLELGHFVPGLGAFLAAHVAYFLAFSWDRWAPKLLRGVPPFAYGLLILGVIGAGLGDLFAPVLAYLVVLCAMLWRAAARIRLPIPSGAQVAGLVGAVLFTLSDTVIAIDRFTAFEHSATRYVIIGTYWVGQLGIALSVDRTSD